MSRHGECGQPRYYSSRVTTRSAVPRATVTRVVVLLAAGSVGLAACGASGPADPAASRVPARSDSALQAKHAAAAKQYLPAPAALAPFGSHAASGQGVWHPAGRPVRGFPAVYETWLVPPGGMQRQQAGIAWLDTRLLSARLYSGSISPGGGPYRYTAPVAPAQAATLVAAFNGGFKMKDAHGGYYTGGQMIDRLRAGAASLVIYADGSLNIGAWGRDVAMTRRVASVRQNLVPLVAGGQPTAAAAGNWRAWGSTCGAHSCAASVPGLEHQWRTGLGITADGALVYVAGSALDPLELASLLVRAGAIRAMQLDINPYWPDFVTYRPRSPHGPAAPSNGRKLLARTVQGAATF